MPVVVSHVLVRVADAAFAIDEVQLSVFMPVHEIITVSITQELPTLWYPLLQLVTVHVPYALHCPVVVSHVLDCVPVPNSIVHAVVAVPVHVEVVSITHVLPTA